MVVKYYAFVFFFFAFDVIGAGVLKTVLKLQKLNSLDFSKKMSYDSSLSSNRT